MTGQVLECSLGYGYIAPSTAQYEGVEDRVSGRRYLENKCSRLHMSLLCTVATVDVVLQAGQTSTSNQLY